MIAFAFLFIGCNQKTAVIETKSETETGKVVSSLLDINEVVANYLKLTNALAKDDSKTAADVAEILFVTLNTLNTDKLDTKGKKEYAEIADAIVVHLKHISDNSTDIGHQREYFALVSKEVNDLIKTFGTDHKLYQAYCPMYDEGKSGYWISETEEIRNPYFGSKMLNCGSIVATVK